MSTIFTIGHTKKSLERFIRLLQDAEVDAVIDIRLRNTSQLAGFAKRDDLAFILREGFGIETGLPTNASSASCWLNAMWYRRGVNFWSATNARACSALNPLLTIATAGSWPSGG